MLPGVRTDLRAITRTPALEKVDALNLAQPEFVRRRRWKRLLRILARRNRDAGVRDNFRVANRELTARPATAYGGWAKFYALASAAESGALYSAQNDDAITSCEPSPSYRLTGREKER